MAFWRATDVDLPSNSKIITVNTGDDVANVYTGYIIQINTGQFLEVKTVNTGASPQTIELFTNYTGASITGGTAIAAPTQGAIKEAAEELRALRTAYEGIADSVATTPVANSVVKRTNTGQIKVADAVETNDAVALGQLGSAATYDVTTSATDTTTNRLLKTGDGGLLRFANGVDYPKSSFNDATCPSGLYRYINTTTDRPSELAAYGYVFIERYDINDIKQTFCDVNGKRGVRLIREGVPQDFNLDYHSGNSVNPLDYGIGSTTGTGWPNGTDLNNLTGVKAGIYKIYVASPTTALGYPAGYTSSSNFTIYFNIEVAELRATMLLIDAKSGATFVRGYNSGWTDWKEIYHTGNSVNPLDYGIGLDVTSQNAPPINNYNTQTKSGLFRSLGNEIGHPINSSISSILNMDRSGTNGRNQLVVHGNEGENNGSLFFRGGNGTAFSDWFEVYHSGNTNFNEFGGSANEVIATGEVVTSAIARFYLPINSPIGKKPISISFTGSFNVIKISTSVISGATTGALSTVSSPKMAVIDITGTGLTVGDVVNLRCAVNNSKIIVNF